MSSFEKRMMLEGKPFRVNFTHDGTAGYANRTAFDLDTVNWDYNADGITETTPFSNQMFIITGMVVTIGAGDTLGGIIIDGKSITYYSNLTAGTYYIDGRSINPTNGNRTRLRDILGGTYNNMGYVMRNKMEVWNSAGATDITISMVGIRLRREY
jgi:hypothetical protein